MKHNGLTQFSTWPRFLAGGLWLGVPLLLAVTVNVPELKRTEKKVRFQNYTGPVKNRAVPSVSRGVGRTLAKKAADRPNTRVRYARNYSLYHIPPPEKAQRLGADIFTIDQAAQVNHIVTLRRMLVGFLEEMYGYSRADASTLALFVSYYNAVYRGDTKFFASRYIDDVTRRLTPVNAGLSPDYRRWAGKSALVIPLTADAKKGRLDAVDPDLISDKKVRDEVRKKEQNLKPRRELVDMKKRIVDDRKSDLKKKTGEARRERKEVEDAKKKLADRKQELEKQKKETKTIEDPERRERAREKDKREERRLQQDTKRVDDKEKKVRRREDDLKKKAADIKKREKRIQRETQEIKRDELRRNIKKDPDKAREELTQKETRLAEREKKLNKREDRLRKDKTGRHIHDRKFYYLRVRDATESGHYTNEMYMIDAATRKVLFKSPVKNIAGPRYYVYSGGVIVVTHEGKSASPHHLTLLDGKTLKRLRTSDETIYWRSFIEIHRDHVYAIMRREGAYYLIRFDERLKKQSVSSVRISPHTFVSFYGDYVYVNRWDKKIAVLKESDLSLVQVIERLGVAKP